MSLTNGQALALAEMHKGKNVHLYGNAGTGKSYVVDQYIHSLPFKDEGKTILCAPTGISAINIGGATIHRTFHVPVRPLGPSEDINPSDVISDARTIIIDEISMVRFDVFTYIARTIQNVNEERVKKGELKKPIQLIVIGDMLQLPPVITDKDRLALKELWGEDFKLGDGYPFLSPEWDKMDFVNVGLTEVVRQSDKEFSHHLDEARVGDKSCLDWFEKNSASSALKNVIYICPTNKQAEEINARELKKYRNKTKFTSKSEGVVASTDKPAPDELCLAKGVRVMTVINDKDHRYQNGSLGTIASIVGDTVTVEFDSGLKVEISPYTWSISNYVVEVDTDCEAEATSKTSSKAPKAKKTKQGKQRKRVRLVEIGRYTQLPFKIAYAITIHKSQGQTYENVNIKPQCFAAGQLYVAISRCKALSGLHFDDKLKPEYLIASDDAIDFYKKIGTHSEDENVTESKETSYKESVLSVSTECIENVTKKSAPSIFKDGKDSFENATKTAVRGGKRDGAGRKPKFGGPTTTIRIPVAAKEKVLNFLASQEWS